MHQTFYIDIEEEISSVIDRLNKSMSNDNYFVVPKRALFLQSIVNMKLLKREADKVGKRVIMVTQDEIGASMAERSGIETVSNMDGLEREIVDIAPLENIEETGGFIEPVMIGQIDQEKNMRLNGVGSSEFYDPSADLKKEKTESPAKNSSARRIPINSISNKEHGAFDDGAAKPLMQSKLQPKINQYREPQGPRNSSYGKQLDPAKAKSLEKMFSSVRNPSNASEHPSSAREGRIKKTMIAFAGLCLLVFAGIAMYLFLPSAKIVITPNILKDKIDLNASVEGTEIRSQESTIPVRVIDFEESVSFPHDVTGSSAVSGKKAHGTVVIYNEYDNSPQTLIATTRLESENGKIFRLVKNVIVPGMTTVAGESKPGAVSAEVIADQAGSDFNLDPSKFTIIGFKGSPKYDKFYAKSSEVMTGGSSDGVERGGAVSQKDIDNAKQETEAALNEKIKEKIRGQLADAETSLPQAEKITITKASSGVKIGDMVSTFDYTMTASVRALVFSEGDLKIIIDGTLKDDAKSTGSKRDVSKIEYGSVDADFEKNILKLQVHAEIVSTPIIDDELIKKELLGKTDEQLPQILRKYPSIKNVNVEFSPAFVSRVPQYGNRVKVEIGADNE